MMQPTADAPAPPPEPPERTEGLTVSNPIRDGADAEVPVPPPTAHDDAAIGVRCAGWVPGSPPPSTIFVRDDGASPATARIRLRSFHAQPSAHDSTSLSRERERAHARARARVCVYATSLRRFSRARACVCGDPCGALV